MGEEVPVAHDDRSSPRGMKMGEGLERGRRTLVLGARVRGAAYALSRLVTEIIRSEQ